MSRSRYFKKLSLTSHWHFRNTFDCMSAFLTASWLTFCVLEPVPYSLLMAASHGRVQIIPLHLCCKVETYHGYCESHLLYLLWEKCHLHMLNFNVSLHFTFWNPVKYKLLSLSVLIFNNTIRLALTMLCKECNVEQLICFECGETNSVLLCCCTWFGQLTGTLTLKEGKIQSPVPVTWWNQFWFALSAGVTDLKQCDKTFVSLKMCVGFKPLCRLCCLQIINKKSFCSNRPHSSLITGKCSPLVPWSPSLSSQMTAFGVFPVLC